MADWGRLQALALMSCSDLVLGLASPKCKRQKWKQRAIFSEKVVKPQEWDVLLDVC